MALQKEGMLRRKRGILGALLFMGGAVFGNAADDSSSNQAAAVDESGSAMRILLGRHGHWIHGQIYLDNEDDKTADKEFFGALVCPSLRQALAHDLLIQYSDESWQAACENAATTSLIDLRPFVAHKQQQQQHNNNPRYTPLATWTHPMPPQRPTQTGFMPPPLPDYASTWHYSVHD